MLSFTSQSADKIRIASLIGFVFGVIQLSIAAVASDILTYDNTIGTWWVGFTVIFTVIFTGLCARRNRYTQMAGLVLSTISMAVCEWTQCYGCDLRLVLSVHDIVV
mmetsp:Transcript_23241/g.39381  ORF Transcript_23241/g.39381 Transcript_23241/m.39381 type:complete len:106 (+) Transcript_23241:80-397(+)